MSKSIQRSIEVWADWKEVKGPKRMGTLFALATRGKEVFSFEYDPVWLSGSAAQMLDPNLGFFQGIQYAPTDKGNFGMFLDSSPDRWGRMLMNRREAQRARDEARKEITLSEFDYLLGVHDGHRPGALRFRIDKDGPFLDNNMDLASPPWTSLRELEHASIEIENPQAERDPNYSKWIRMLIAPGGSLGGARPKASVLDGKKHLWIAKFPSSRDEIDVGAWEAVVHELAFMAGIVCPAAQIKRFASDKHTFLTKRFDRTNRQARRHFASAMTLLQRSDGDDASTGTSYLELAEFLTQFGGQTNEDLEQLWRRIVFFICVSNTDDHLRNHGFLLQPTGWSLAPAYDMNPDPFGSGLKLNISETDNSQDLELARQVARYFRIKDGTASEIINTVLKAVDQWHKVSIKFGLSKTERDLMASAFMRAQS